MAILSIGELLGIGPDELSGFVPYTAIGGSGNVISGINGSGLSGAGTDTTAVSAIASAYAESAASGKLDNSASSTWYPMTGNPAGFLVNADISGYATTTYVDSSVSGKADTTSLTAYQTVDGMSAYQPSGDYAYNSSVSAKVDQTAFDTCCSSVESAISALTDSASALSADMSSLSSDVTSMSSDISSLSSDVSSISGDLSGKQDVTGMSAYALSSDVSSVISVVESSSGSWGGGVDYTGIVPIYVDNVDRTINISSMPLGVDSSMTAYVSGDAMLFGVDGSVLNTLSALSAWALDNGWTGI